MPVGELLGRAPRRSRGKAVWRALVQWRDWSLPVKLSAVTVVPIVLALVLGVATIAAQVGRSGEYQRLDRLVALGGGVRTLTAALQQERTVTSAMLTAGTVGGTPELAAARKATDAATGPFTAEQDRAAQAEPGVSGAGGTASAQLGNLAFLRRQVDGGQLDPGQAITAYSALTGSLISLDTAATAGAGDGTLGGLPAGLHELLVAGEQVSLSQALVSYGIGRAGLTPSELATLRAAELRLADRLVDFRSAAGDTLQRDFAAIAEGTQAQSRARMVETVLNAQSSAVDDAFRALPAADWNAASGAMRAQIGAVADRLGASASQTAADLVDESSSGAGLLAVLLFAAMVLAVAVVFLITRQLLRSLKVLRRSALDVAETALPEAVRNIQEGRAQGTDVRPVPVHTDDEVGEVARAFDKVHHQALRLATEQAAMRTGYGSVFVNLSRRSQSLVQRQLQLIEQLERDEEDADQLATLFQLDHLATRMRRNNENLMVLSGAEPGRRSGKPVGTTDMLRAAVSEIEQYQRVQVQPPPPARIVGYAASDLMRLVAELLDNATAFSAPETTVTVASRMGEDGSLDIDILDKGIGMNEVEVAEANTRLTEAGSLDLVTSRRMGLFVVGRLASRHRIGVSLHGGKDIVGVRATVVVPAELVMPLTDGPATGPIGALQQHPASPAAGNRLPRRPVNGAARPRPVVPPQPAMGEERWPSASDLAGLSGVRPPSDLEISGTALFAPIEKDEDVPPQRPALPQVPAVLPLPAGQPPRGDDLPAGKDLFTANETTLSDWWQEATAGSEPPPPAPAPDRSETTPIFDEMLSAWFREDKPAPEEEPAASASAEAAPEERRSWDFASDENFRTVQERTKAEPTAFTDAGLPRRRRGEQLLPGSATPSGPAATPKPAPARPDLPVRDPADVRGRLSSFQQGVTRGRRQAAAQRPRGGQQRATQPAPASPTVPGLGTAQDAAAAQQAAAAQTAAAQQAAGQSSGPAQDTPEAAGQAGAAQLAGSQGSTGEGADSAQAAPEAFGQAGAAQRAGSPESNGQGASSAQAAPELFGQPGQRAGSQSAASQSADSSQAASELFGQPGQRAGSQAAAGQGADSAQAAPEAFGQPGPQSGAAQQPSGAPAAAAQQASAGSQPEASEQPDSPSRPRLQGDIFADGTQPPAEDPRPGAPAPDQGTRPPLPQPSRGAAKLPQRSVPLPQPSRPRPGPEPAVFQDSGQLPVANGRPGVPPSSLPSRKAPETPAPRREETSVEATAEWNFGTDDGWRAVQAVSQSTPPTFTSAGLPRRRRGEQLLPGSAGPSTGASAPRPQRDAHDVRGRLRSFQQGIERGRHRTAQAAETNHETLEGE
ncbi:nitrate- and nitrite sensing domain-containing protein [Amycolatopsis mediterranei]|uniref:sensor histidine kinase n=1 Tax=Amycolatopsis mediterranei TaxID=33910 RepID=UPI0004A08841|nr:nitrate- and nitrite sensing domain-containing protein [Amycolatopsis mediterranei]KDO06797.1 histidine kinase [Amycolatopsis mediterranei]UZF76094.1 nitrate- and nitrite sensing domain-containing protein [Amycolatopsis mediterranei]